MSRYAIGVGADWGRAVAAQFPTAVVREHGRWLSSAFVRALEDGLRYAFFLNWSNPVSALEYERIECVNFHCTPLPYGRGGHPIENSILHGHTETVITAHRMTARIDAGPIYGVSAPVSLAGTKDEILARFVAPCAQLIRWIVETEPTPQPQVGVPTYFKRLSPVAYQAFWEARTRE